MSKPDEKRSDWEQGTEGNLITDCTAFGIYVAGTLFGLQYGTGEVSIVLKSARRQRQSGMD